MNEQALARFLSDKAEQINAEHGRCLESAQTALVHAIQVGRLLNEVKAKLPHGEWSSWIGTHAAFSDRTARQYMQLASHDRQLKSAARDNPQMSIDEAIKLLAVPREPGTGPLTKAEKAQLAEHEAAIEAELPKFKAACAALAEVRDRELWRAAGVESWNAYCMSRVGQTADEVNENIDMAAQMQSMPT